MPETSAYEIYPCGDHAASIVLGDGIDPAVNRKVIALFTHLKAHPIDGMKDIIPAYDTLTVVYDLPRLVRSVHKGTVYETICEEIAKRMEIIGDEMETRPDLVRIPVCYDPSLAPDIVSLAALHKITVEELVKLHTGTTYRVYMIGFLPGFAYMGTLPKQLISARKEKPRTMVPAGSVGIAGEQTGIYPFDSPGGWQLIGQTPVPLFTVSEENPCYLQPGNEVRFYPVSVTEFKQLQKYGPAHS